MKEFKGFTIQSTISDSAHSNSGELVDAVCDSEELVDAVSNYKELVDAVSSPKRDPSNNPKVATYDTNGNYTHKLLANSEIPEIIQDVISPVHQATVDEVSKCGGALHALCTVLSEEIVTGLAASAACVFKDPYLCDRLVSTVT